MRWRPMRADDLPAVHRIGNEVYPPPLHESLEAVRSRLAFGADFSFVLAAGAQVRGYLAGHPWDESIPPLNRVLAPPARGSRAFLHDLALLPAARGSGAAREGVARFLARARRHSGRAALVAVNASLPFWTRRGFRAAEAGADLAAYGGDAVLMTWQAHHLPDHDVAGSRPAR
ncbi:GCN5-related N-acetyltransferase [Methylobacterium sp. 4-46]|uniref:GNAT family N-acetyltransferase n=1 Tax=unclassified Methylobacterium TaxID=2615210 RepID=UPI000152E6BC|nr:MULTISPECIES: GNAT family N-acetyltransferase [Methylobacterium]ACA15582.1 GCN5-related N-acetyltransferase [Methylobacterium sp. 4-46]WFT81295.1 GNAT family N-acetyltransferase [Methylobacterium nodulans]